MYRKQTVPKCTVLCRMYLTVALYIQSYHVQIHYWNLCTSVVCHNRSHLHHMKGILFSFIQLEITHLFTIQCQLHIKQQLTRQRKPNHDGIFSVLVCSMMYVQLLDTVSSTGQFSVPGPHQRCPCHIMLKCAMSVYNSSTNPYCIMLKCTTSMCHYSTDLYHIMLEVWQIMFDMKQCHILH